MSEPHYPLMVRFKGGRVRHRARIAPEGDAQTACKKRRPVVDAGDGLPLCADCSTRTEDGMTPAEAVRMGGQR